MMLRSLFMSVYAVLLASTVLSAQPNPMVNMSVTLPDGQTKELSAPESGTATFTLKDGTEIGVRPTIQDSKPWTRVVVTFFKMPTSTRASEMIGSLEVKTGAPAAQVKSSPVFKVAVTSISEPPSPTS